METEQMSRGGEILGREELRSLAMERFTDHKGRLVPWFYEQNEEPITVDQSNPLFLDQLFTFDYKLFDSGAEYVPKGSTYELESNPRHELENPFDLRNLRFINPEVVVSAVEQLDRAVDNNLPSVCVIATGGTIASKKTHDIKLGEVETPGLDLDYLFDYAGRQLDRQYNRASLSFPKLIDSSQMKLDYDADVVIAISYIWKKMSARARDKFQGFLITHGTDTKAPSATRIAFMLGSNLDFSVGIVGAQKSIARSTNEIGENIANSLYTLSELSRYRKHAVFVYMGGSSGAAYHPAGVLKISDTAVKGFDSPAIPPILPLADDLYANLNLPFITAYQQPDNPNQRDYHIDRFQPTIVRGDLNSFDITATMDMPEERLRRIFGLLTPEELEFVGKISRNMSSEEIKKLDGLIRTVRPSDLAVITETYGSFTFDERQIDIISQGVKDNNLMWFGTNPFPTGEIHGYKASKYMLEPDELPVFRDTAVPRAVPISMLKHASAAKLKLGVAIYGNRPETRDKLRALLTANSLIGEQPVRWVKASKLSAEREMRQWGQPRESLPKDNLIVYP